MPTDAELEKLAKYLKEYPEAHRFLRGRFGKVDDTLDGFTEFGTCWDMVWIYDTTQGQEVQVWWANVPRFCFWMMVGYFRCMWLQGVRRRRG